MVSPGQHDGCAAVDFQQRADVLQEAQLPVAGSGPEIGPLHHQALPPRLSLGVDVGQGGRAAKGRIGQHHVVVDAGRRTQAVVHLDVGAVAADAVEVQVHHTQPCCAVHDFSAARSVVPRKFRLLPVHGRVM